MAGVTGDFKKLREMVRGFERIASAQAKAALNRQLAHEALSKVQEGFETSKDPYGRPWAPLRSRSGAILRDTNRLMNSISIRSSSTGFAVFTNVKYAAIHNYGGIIRAKRAPYLMFRVGGSKAGKGKTWVRVKQVKIPMRMFIPTGQQLPKAWGVAFRAVARTWLRQQGVR